MVHELPMTKTEKQKILFMVQVERQPVVLGAQGVMVLLCQPSSLLATADWVHQPLATHQ